MSLPALYDTLNAHIEGNSPRHFGDPQTEYRRLMTHTGLWIHPNRPFTLAGDEVQRWCNGMLSNNIRRLSPQQGNRNAICSPKGILEGLLDIYCLNKNLFLCLPDGIDGPWFTQRFRQFLFLDDIELESLENHRTIRLMGPRAYSTAQALGYALPNDNEQCTTPSEDIWAVFSTRFGLPSVDIICPDSLIESIIEQAQHAGTSLVGQEAYDHCRIERCSAAWPDDRYSEKPLLHALRLNADCCAFDKGCYVGQEVINRIDVKGKLGRKLQVLKLSAAVPSGTPLHDNGKERAVLTSISTLDQIIGLAVLPKAYWAEGSVLSLGDTGEFATVITPVTPNIQSANSPE